MNRKSHNTDISDDEWVILKPPIPASQPGGRPRFRDIREIVNAVLYIQRAGCAWRLLPHEFSPWQTVYHFLHLAYRGGVASHAQSCS